MSAPWTKYNLNDKIRFEMTEKGKEYIARLNEHHPIYKLAPITFLETEDGKCETELWHFMQYFGSELYNGCNPPVKMDIELKSNL